MKSIDKQLKVITIASAVMLLSSNTVMAAADVSPTTQEVQDNMVSIKSEIPKEMKPGTIITYNINGEPTITIDPNSNKSSNSISSTQNSKASKKPNKKIVDKQRAAEDALVNSIKEAAKNFPKISLGYELPAPEPGMMVIYGSDGRINHIYPDKNAPASTIKALSNIPTSTVKYPGRLPVGVYTYGKGDSQKVTIAEHHVLGEGRFTVFRAGVGGSGTKGSSGKILGAGDVATKRQIDNPTHNTSIEVRALDTDIAGIVRKNDIGSLPDAVLDNYFWGWNDTNMGYKYSDTLSFRGRYFYRF